MKAKFFFPGLLAVLGVAFYLVFNAPSSDVGIEDFGPHEEADFSIEGAMNELAPEDRWMLQFIDPPAGVSPKDVYAFDCDHYLRRFWNRGLENKVVDVGR
jgi:hypothetical protein